jgi:hypothetical protein
MIQLAWRFLLFQKNSALTHWYRTRTAGAGKNRKTMIAGGLVELLPGGRWWARRRTAQRRARRIEKRQVQLHGCSPRVAPTRAFDSGERRCLAKLEQITEPAQKECAVDIVIAR